MRALHRDDLGSVLSIERQSFPSPWPRALFEQELINPISRCWVAEPRAYVPQRKVAGYLCVWRVHDEMHIMNLAVHPQRRRQGIARALLDHAIHHARSSGRVRRSVLEVRKSNKAAQALYRSMGFRVVGQRAGYYRDTGEDALVMVRKIEREDSG